jgi:flagellar motility protein MotE (MotC chaperone)
MADAEPTDDGSVKFSDLRNVITEVVKDILGTDKKDPEPTEEKKAPEYEADNSKTARQQLADQVKAELEKIRDSDNQESEKKSLQERLQNLEAKLEKTPVERRRVHKMMGWGE